MNAAALKPRNPPIVEAILDIDCESPPGFDLAALEEPARERFRDRYPKFNTRLLHELEIEKKAEALPKLSSSQAVQAYQFFHDDEKQLVQVRAQGFSFNRLAPYSSLDDYLPEIERTWQLYVEMATPVATRNISLRYINRILLPTEAGKVELDDYLEIGPRLPDEESQEMTGFLIQHAAVEKDTGHRINLLLTARAPENEMLPVILDISVANPLREEPDNWPAIRQAIDSLRRLKNRIFQNTLTDKCLQLFQ